MPYKDPEKRKAASKRSVAKKPEHYRNYAREQGRLRSKRGYFLNWRYGITLEEFEHLLEAQSGKCAICKNESKPTKSGRTGLHIDHCHVTGKVRSLLCPRCNNFVGHFEQPDGSMLAEKVKEYLANHS